MRVSLAAANRPSLDQAAPDHLLAPGGARVILGREGGEASPRPPIAAGASTLFAPRGACLAGPRGPLLVSDSGHHRVLIWHRSPTRDGAPADLVLGQRDLVSEGPNAGGTAGAGTLNLPTGIAFGSGVLAVADAWNHRVLLWHGMPRRSGEPADIVLGQSDVAGGLANRGGSAPRADTLNWCYGVAIADGRLIVADTGNRRVLVWDTLPTAHGTPADLVLGQPGFSLRDEGAGEAPGMMGMRWPHGVVATGGGLFVADAGMSRVMVWRRFPTGDGAPCDLILGQDRPSGSAHNRGRRSPTSSGMSMPYGMARLGDRLAVADTANSRLLGFALDALATGAPASALSGQPDFDREGDNRWGRIARDSLCWPYGIASCGATAVVADTGNDRVLLWEAA